MTRLVKVKVMKSHGNLTKGQVTYVPMTPGTAHLIVEHYLELMEDPRWHGYESADLPSGESLSD